MPVHVECPTCGETEDLVGSRGVEGIRIASGACEAFLRDQRLRCATCHGTDLVSGLRCSLSSRGEASCPSWAGPGFPAAHAATPRRCCAPSVRTGLRPLTTDRGPSPGEHLPERDPAVENENTWR